MSDVNSMEVYCLISCYKTQLNNFTIKYSLHILFITLSFFHIQLQSYSFWNSKKYGVARCDFDDLCPSDEDAEAGGDTLLVGKGECWTGVSRWSCENWDVYLWLHGNVENVCGWDILPLFKLKHIFNFI